MATSSDQKENPLKKLKFDNKEKNELSKLSGKLAAEEQKITKKVIKKKPTESHINFSFKLWTQIENFGLGLGVDVHWFATLLEKLKDLSNKTTSQWESDGKFKDAYRIHPINYQSRNCPFKDKNDLFEKIFGQKHFEIDPEIEVYQFQLSKARGRVVGFLDAQYSFNILLLDPLHNIQPSRDFDYRVDPTRILDCEFTKVENKIGVILSMLQEKNLNQEQVKVEISSVLNNEYFDHERRFIAIPKAKFQDIIDILEIDTSSHCMDDVIENALIHYYEKLTNKNN